MKRLWLVLVASLVLAGCAGLGDDDDPTATAPPATATGVAQVETTPTAAEATATSTTAPATATGVPVEPTPTDVVITVATATPGGNAGQPTPTTGGDPTALEAVLAQILADTSVVRELDLLHPVPAEIIGREQLRANLIVELESEYSQEEADADTLELWLLRLVPDRDLDLYQLQLDLLSEQVAGYYDPDRDELFIISDAGNGGELGAEGEYTASHEYVHALQDQHFDLETVQGDTDGDADRGLGITSLIEGDASLSSTLYLFQYMGDRADDLFSGELGSTSVIDSAPAYVSESLIFPYEHGIEFATALYLAGGNAAIDAAFADPPISTEQILHPEKYTAEQRDDPQAVDLPELAGALGSGWSQTDTDTLGEFDFQVLLRENGANDADSGAAGWGGARFVLLQNGEQAVVALRTVWDTPAEADEFYEALLETLPAGADGGEIVSDGTRFYGVSFNGDEVVYVAGTDAAAVGAALGALGAAA